MAFLPSCSILQYLSILWDFSTFSISEYIPTIWYNVVIPILFFIKMWFLNFLTRLSPYYHQPTRLYRFSKYQIWKMTGALPGGLLRCQMYPIIALTQNSYRRGFLWGGNADNQVGEVFESLKILAAGVIVKKVKLAGQEIITIELQEVEDAPAVAASAASEASPPPPSQPAPETRVETVTPTSTAQTRPAASSSPPNTMTGTIFKNTF